MIEVGDTVECINDSDPEQSDAPYVIKGRIYTVAKIERVMWPIGEFMGITISQAMIMIWVEGLPSKTGHFGFRFRKVEKKSEEKKTSIEVFTKMLDKQPEKVK
jgi:hypothetical protein